MIEYLVPVLAFAAVVCLGGSVVLRVAGNRARMRERMQQAEAGIFLEGNDARPSLGARLLMRVGSLSGSKDPSKTLRMQMVRAGFTGGSAVSVYLGAKLLLFVLGATGGGILVGLLSVSLLNKLLIVMASASIPFFIPNMVLSLRVTQRTEEVRLHLPDVVDLLEICVGGGMGLDMAWNAVADEIRAVSPLLADEMALTNLEIHLGEGRGEAIRHMAERTGATDLSSLVAVLVQSERFGTSLSDALKVFAASMREERSQRAEEAAEKMGTKMIFPMVLCIFPVVLIVAVGPAVIKLIEVFSKT